MDCIFCKIVAGEIPAHNIYEDEKTLAFLDINPVNIGHTLVIPKEHYAKISETPEEFLCAIISTVKRITPAIMKVVEREDYNVTANNGVIAGQVVFHTHFHIIPRFSGDGFGKFRLGPYKNGEGEILLDRIKAELK